MNVTLCTRYTVERCVKNMPQGVNFVSVWNNFGLLLPGMVWWAPGCRSNGVWYFTFSIANQYWKFSIIRIMC